MVEEPLEGSGSRTASWHGLREEPVDLVVELITVRIGRPQNTLPINQIQSS
jgi:hypothetical protein